MCGRYTLHTEKDALAARFEFDPADLRVLPPRYNVAPSDQVLALVAREGARRPVFMRWGLVPSFATSARGPAHMINARIETLARNSAFSDSLRFRRCLVPADGFYEWQAVSRLARRKLPHLVARADGEPFAMAGLWAEWRPRDALLSETLVSCTIVTTEANAAVRPLHDRMPVILPRANEARWLDPTLNGDTQALLALLAPVDAAELVTRPVSRRVNSVKNDDPSLLVPDPNEPSLGFF
ncbi:MAG TPA: SOS response-associated peptidase [Myxococcota bacterium]|nr:SOS response-associated peptidase [Myxococcota bacterium]